MLDVLSAGSFISVQGLLDGLTVGMVYVLLAAGLSVIFGVMHVINFAHGELYAFGAYFAAAIVTPLGGGLGFYVALVVAPLLVGVMGVAIERFTVRPLYGRDPLYHILLTFGLVLVLNDLIKLIWGLVRVASPARTISRAPSTCSVRPSAGTRFSSSGSAAHSHSASGHC
ncbi:branched-chain amino acid ABC transporter permease [Halovenus salina]|uniref:Branched-chain amino acid ABC transporter permease n=1 Tax=Halovenus salina TaxID=1510225 RepID=A0ABD5W4Q4_9EURY